ncbi:hypothetical protein GGR57DRAFT_452634 [Xylariaceae sp. FL1272]|nr:hypothetical protein GGR57DRAFT_452634 [Xylariaceae sp. FL1272]
MSSIAIVSLLLKLRFCNFYDIGTNKTHLLPYQWDIMRSHLFRRAVSMTTCDGSTQTRTCGKSRNTRRRRSCNPVYRPRTTLREQKYGYKLRDYTNRTSKSTSSKHCYREVINDRSSPQIQDQTTTHTQDVTSPKLSSVSTFHSSSSAKPPSSKTSGAPSVCDDYVHVSISVHTPSQISESQHNQQPTSATATGNQLVNSESNSAHQPSSSRATSPPQSRYTYDADNGPRHISEYDANREIVSLEYRDLFEAHFGKHSTTCSDETNSFIDTYWTWDANKQMWHHKNEETNSERWFSAEIR